MWKCGVEREFYFRFHVIFITVLAFWLASLILRLFVPCLEGWFLVCGAVCVNVHVHALGLQQIYFDEIICVDRLHIYCHIVIKFVILKLLLMLSGNLLDGKVAFSKSCLNVLKISKLLHCLFAWYFETSVI